MSMRNERKLSLLLKNIKIPNKRYLLRMWIMQIAGRYMQKQDPGSDPRDFLLEPNFWASQALPRGVSIDQAIKDGLWEQIEKYRK
jgi:hypothetical protein